VWINPQSWEKISTPERDVRRGEKGRSGLRVELGDRISTEADVLIDWHYSCTENVMRGELPGKYFRSSGWDSPESPVTTSSGKLMKR
jgi:hypothetical protein